MKILFIVPKIKSMFGGKGMTTHPHVGVAYLSAFLKQNNIQTAIFDEGIDDDLKTLFQFIVDFKPDLIGITIFSYCYGYAYNLIQKIKERSAIPIVAGGPHISAVGKELFADTKIDFAIKQEGEFTLLELMKELDKNNPCFDGIKGLIWRGQSEIRENPDRELIIELDKLPFPDYESFGIEGYPCYKLKMLPIITSRGCPFGCNYCSVRLSMGMKFRARSAENVVEEIKQFSSAGFNSFDINDDCFTLDQARAEKICDLIIESKLKIRFQLYNGIRVDTVSPGLLKKLRQAGCFFISYGCESGNDKVLKAIKKGITLEQVKNAVEWTNDAGIPNAVNFIIGHKNETYKDALDTIKFAGLLDTNFVNFYNLVPYPGTESFIWAKNHARFLVPVDSFLESISYRDNKPIFETDEFTDLQRREIILQGFNLYKKKILTFRLGKVLGSLIYWITKSEKINRLASNFALSNPTGKVIYTLFSRKSLLLSEKANCKVSD
ncbi:MAG: radical SAM protein [Candidatus Omnitrophica bacterium]|nr:radical SAM protein [Candidatus Omnitrophota bacterium]